MKDFDKQIIERTHEEMLKMYDRDLTQFRRVGYAILTLLQQFNLEVNKK